MTLETFLATYLPAPRPKVETPPPVVYNFTWTGPTKEQPECPH